MVLMQAIEERIPSGLKVENEQKIHSSVEYL